MAADETSMGHLSRGVFLAFEGIDGGGKTTQAFLLKERIERRGIQTVYVKEPTSGRWGRKVRAIAQDGRSGISPEEELNYFILDREEDVRDNIRPALDRNQVVIADRYYYSTIAYQSALGLDPEEIRRRNAHFPTPDLVFLLDLPVQTSHHRIVNGRRESANVGYEQAGFLGRVKAAFDAMADPNIVRIDSGRDKQVVADHIWEVAEKLLRGLIV